MHRTQKLHWNRVDEQAEIEIHVPLDILQSRRGKVDVLGEIIYLFMKIF